MKTLAEVTKEVADEWAEEGRPVTVPPDADGGEEAFWDEVQKRYDDQVVS